MLKTVSIGVESLCINCACHCRYCLLNYDGNILGADYNRSQRFAEKFYEWIKVNRKDLNFHFYTGYSMDYAQLSDNIKFAQSINYIGGEFLQLNGLKFRTAKEVKEFLTDIYSYGIKTIDLTFYGLKEYHDKFAGRAGDFEFLILLLKSAVNVGLNVHISVPVIKENMQQMQELFNLLEKFKPTKIGFFLPHGKGRGYALEPLRLTLEDYENLPQAIRKNFYLSILKTESEWVKSGIFTQKTKRTLILSLTKQNIDELENTRFDKIISDLEHVDDEYYEIVPSAEILAKMYGNISNMQLFRERDLYLKWQKMFIDEHCPDVYDMNDESHNFSVRS